MDGGSSRRASRQSSSKSGKAAASAASRTSIKRPVKKKTGGKIAAGQKLAGKPARAKHAGAGRVAEKRAAASKAPVLRLALMIEDSTWQEVVPAAAALVRKAARRAMAQAAADGWQGSDMAHEICLVLSDNRRVRRLNRQYRGKDKPTNVLSFAALDAGRPPRSMPWHLGDVVLALGVLRQEARQQKKAVTDHLTHLVIHGVLHLLGYDHEDDADAERMEGLEIAALERLGIDNPYLAI